MDKNAAEKHREKIGTILDRKVADELRKRSEQEDRSISEIIQEAVLTYRAEEIVPKEQRLAAVKRFCTPPEGLNRKKLKELAGMDYYVQ